MVFEISERGKIPRLRGAGRLEAASSREPHVESGAPQSSALQMKMRFHPQRWAKVYDHWMGNIQDWCISRQLWWGHRIPVWSILVKCENHRFFNVDQCLTDNLEDMLDQSKATESAIAEMLFRNQCNYAVRAVSRIQSRLGGIKVQIQLQS